MNFCYLFIVYFVIAEEFASGRNGSRRRPPWGRRPPPPWGRPPPTPYPKPPKPTYRPQPPPDRRPPYDPQPPPQPPTGGIVEEENVLVLNKDNFEEAVRRYPFLLIDYYVPWCGYCTRLEPKYAAAATQLKQQSSNIKLAKVNVNVEKELFKKLLKQGSYQGYPILRFYNNGNAVDYSGGLETHQIISWLKSKSVSRGRPPQPTYHPRPPHNTLPPYNPNPPPQPPAGKIVEEENVLVLNKNNLEEAVRRYPFLLIDYYEPRCGRCKRVEPSFAAAATQLKPYGSIIRLAKVNMEVEKELTRKLFAQGSYRSLPILRFYKHRYAVDYDGGFETYQIIAWLESNTRPRGS